MKIYQNAVHSQIDYCPNFLIVSIQIFFFQSFEKNMMLTCAQIKEAVPNTVEYAKGDPEKIGHSVGNLFYCKIFLQK